MHTKLTHFVSQAFSLLTVPIGKLVLNFIGQNHAVRHTTTLSAWSCPLFLSKSSTLLYQGLDHVFSIIKIINTSLLKGCIGWMLSHQNEEKITLMRILSAVCSGAEQKLDLYGKILLCPASRSTWRGIESRPCACSEVPSCSRILVPLWSISSFLGKNITS